MDASKWNLAAGTIAMHFQRFATPVGLVIAEIAIEGTDVGYDSQTKSVRVGKPAEFVAVIEESDLDAFIKDQTPAGVDIESIHIEPGFIVAKASVNMLIRINGMARCILEIEGGKRLNVRAESVDVLGGSMLSTVQKQLDSMNPVVDVSDLPVDVRLGSVEIEKERITLTGTLAPKS